MSGLKSGPISEAKARAFPAESAEVSQRALRKAEADSLR